MPGWSTPRALPTHWFGPTLSFDGAGRATAAYTQVLSWDPIATRVAVAELQADATWLDVFDVESGPDGVPSSVTIASGPDGAAVACYTMLSSADVATATGRVLALWRPATGSPWEAPVEIVGPSARIGTVEARVATNGSVVLLVHRFEGDVDDPDNQVGSLVIASRTAAGAWTPAQPVSGPGEHVEDAQLGLDGAGNATIAWLHRWQTNPAQRRSIRVATRATNGAISAPTVLTPETGMSDAGSLRLALNASGAAVLAGQIGSHVSVTTRPSQAAAWEPLTALFDDTSAATSHPAAVGVSPAGTSHVLFWRQGPTVSSNDVAGVARRGWFGAWSPPLELSAPNFNLTGGAIVFVGQDAALLYTGAFGFGGGFPGTGVLQFVRWPPYALEPPDPVDLVPPGPSQGLVQIVADNLGGVVVIERNWDTGTERLLAIAYDATPPRLASATVPSEVTVGETVQLRTRFVDAWSDLGATTWDFDDGSPPGTGPTVTHAWAARGSYDVEVTAADVHGNTATTPFTITVQ